MGTPHKHSELIKLWADGARIQYRHRADWIDVPTDDTPQWNPETKYRVKPREIGPFTYEQLQELFTEYESTLADHSPDNWYVTDRELVGQAFSEFTQWLENK